MQALFNMWSVLLFICGAAVLLYCWKNRNKVWVRDWSHTLVTGGLLSIGLSIIMGFEPLLKFN